MTRALPLLGGGAVVREPMATQTFGIEGAGRTFAVELTAPHGRIATVVDELRQACDARALRMTPSTDEARAKRLRIVVGARSGGDECDLVVTRWTPPLATALAAALAGRRA